MGKKISKKRQMKSMMKGLQSNSAVLQSGVTPDSIVCMEEDRERTGDQIVDNCIKIEERVRLKSERESKALLDVNDAVLVCLDKVKTLEKGVKKIEQESGISRKDIKRLKKSIPELEEAIRECEKRLVKQQKELEKQKGRTDCLEDILLLLLEAFSRGHYSRDENPKKVLKKLTKAVSDWDKARRLWMWKHEDEIIPIADKKSSFSFLTGSDYTEN